MGLNFDLLGCENSKNSKQFLTSPNNSGKNHFEKVMTNKGLMLRQT